jgi:UDPglucose 6-dehydrogenase
LTYLNSRSQDEIKKGIQVQEDPYEVCKGAHAIAVLTEWDEFRSYDWQRIYDNMQKPAFVFDGRNISTRKNLSKSGLFLVE